MENTVVEQQNYQRQNGFEIKWEHIESKITSMPDGYFMMRGWQERAFDQLRESPFMILNAPMGSGKSWLMCFLSAYKMKANTSLRSIIAVPQTIIAPGFAHAKLQMPDGEKLDWYTKHNLCNEEISLGTVNYLIKWLENSPEDISDRFLLCTHATLVKAYQKIKTINREDLLKNLLLWIDEAHHVKNIAMKDMEGPAISNELGQLVAKLLGSSNINIQLGLTTASFFRGDRCSLLTPEMELLFQGGRFNLAYDEYLASMKNLKSFSFDFLLCGSDYTNAIEILAKGRKGRDIIYIPHPKSRHATGDKYKEVSSIIQKYQNVHGGNIIDLDSGITILENNNNQFKILDLVDEHFRSEKKSFINSPILKDDKKSLDVIIALGMFKEGANWIWADRSIIVGARSSLVDIIQMIGRLFRDAEEKEHVEVVQLLPFSLDHSDNDKFKENLNNYLKAIYAVLILEDILNPVNILTPKVEKSNNDSTLNSPSKSQSRMSELIPDETTRKSVIETATRHLIEISADNQNKSVTELYETFQKSLPNVLSDHIDNQSEAEEVGKHIWSMHLHRTFKLQGINVESIDLDIVIKTHPLEGLIRYTSGICNITTFQSLRAAIASTKEDPNIRWNRFFELLLIFIEAQGHSQVPYDYQINEDRLGYWVALQRKNYKNRSLKTEQIIKLESIQDWAWDKMEYDWQTTYSLLKTYMEKSNSPNLPEGFTIDGINVFSWASIQRKTYKTGKLSLSRQCALESLPHWYWDYSDTRNSKGKEALLIFLNREGHLRVPTTHKEGKYPLGIWTKQKKDLYLSNELSNEEVNFFESFPEWSWKDINEQTWDYGYSILEKFVSANGHAQPTSNTKMEGFSIATWVKSQRDAYSKGSLEEDKIVKLSALPGWSWQVFEDRNNTAFAGLDSFVKREGHALVPTEHIENGFKLGKWVALKRLAAKNPNSNYKLTDEHRKKLESYPGWNWNGMDGRWEKGKQYLLNFCTREGHSRVVDSHIEDGFELGRWIGIWRYQYNKKKLSQDKIDFFESLPKWSWDVKTDRWNEGFDILKEYILREGHAFVPAKHVEGDFKLGIWVRTQKYSYAKQSYGKKLSEDKITLLESLPEWSWGDELGRAWGEGYSYLQKFVDIYRHANVSAKFILEEYKLGIWVSGQRYSYKTGKLSDERIVLLEQIPGWAWKKRKSCKAGKIS